MSRNRFVQKSNADRFRDAMRRQRADTAAVDLEPKSAHEALTRAMVADTSKDLDRLRLDVSADVDELSGRVNTLIWVIVGAVALDFVGRLIGL